jgi:outer membrane protein assembly factor BamB
MSRKLVPLALVTGWLLAAAAPVVFAQAERPAQPGGQLGPSHAAILGTRGICVFLGERGCENAIALARNTQWRVYVPLPTLEDVAAAARVADAAGLLGKQVFVEKQPPGRIGLADNIADAVVASGNAAGTPKTELLRVLRPEGRALIIGKTADSPEPYTLITKPIPPGIDEWSHHYHGPNNNPQSLDKLARSPYLTQFIVEPRYAPAPQAAVASGGRLFMAFGNVAWHQREEPMLNTLVVLNAYNGTTLWTRPLPPGIMVDRSTMVATPTALYLADDKSCKVLDAATGKQIDEIVAPADLAGGTFWKWMALEGGTLYALVGQQEPPDPDARWRSTNHGWPWDAISKGYNAPQYPWGFAKTLLAIDAKTKKVLWSHQEDPAIDSRSLCMANGRMYMANFGNYLVSLDAKTGREVWRRTAQKDPEVFKTIGPYRPGQGYIGGWKSTVFLKCTDKAVYVLGPQVQWLTALSAGDGQVLFKHPVMDLHIVIRDEGLYCIGPQHSKNQTKKLDPLTGEVLASYDIQRRACTRSTGTPDGIFFRGHEGSGRLDIATGQVQWLSPVRPSCHVGVVVAFGHLYWLPWACDCNLQMFGAMSVGPAGDFAFNQKATEADRLERLVEPGAIAAFPQSPSDWPTFRADSGRSAHTSAPVPSAGRPTLAWRYSPKSAGEITAPVAAGGLVFVGGHDGTVRALDAANGEVRWTAYTGGPVRYPPTIAEGLALVGSSDGWAYAFEAATGRLVWRFRAAPADRKIPVYGQLVSTWPVASGVLVQDGVACFAAGMNDFDGTHVYALDVRTGKIRWQNNGSGHLDAFGRRGVTCQGEMLFHDGKLYLAGGNAVSPAVFDFADGRCLNNPPGGMGSQAPRGRELYLVSNRVAVSGQPLYSQPQTPVFDQSVRWADVIVTAKNAQLTLRQQRGLSPSGWVLAAREPRQGKDLWIEPLPGEPVRWGIAVDAPGRILVSLRSGDILCYGEKARE